MGLMSPRRFSDSRWQSAAARTTQQPPPHEGTWVWKPQRKKSAARAAADAVSGEADSSQGEQGVAAGLGKQSNLTVSLELRVRIYQSPENREVAATAD